MKLKNFPIYFLFLSVIFSLKAEEINERNSLKNQLLFASSLQEVASLGAPTSGSLVEGCVGSIQKGCRHRFYCHSAGPIRGFLGSQKTVKPISLKDQPGVFPAPAVGIASISFEFECEETDSSIIPVIIKPDGTVYQGLAMTAVNSPQTLEVAAPAQTGIYTLFVMSHEKQSLATQVSINASISTYPQKNRTIHLKSFEKDGKDAELMSGEFIYTHSS